MTSATDKKGYRDAFKSTSIYGGVQLITILFTIVRTKVIALFIGPSGLGLMSLLNSVVELIKSICGLGLSSSIVREVAVASGTGQEKMLQKALNRWVLFSSLLGFFVTTLFSKKISIWAFNSEDYRSSIVLVSGAILFSIIADSFNSYMQGYRKVKYLALASVTSSFLLVVLTVPLFYILGAKAIIIYINIVAIVSFFVNGFFLYKSGISLRLSFKQNINVSFRLGINALKLGAVLSLSTLGVYLVELILKSYIFDIGGTVEVGLYQAGWSINTAYIGIILTAIAKDFYPRLSQLSNNLHSISEALNKQIEISFIILAPILGVMILFASFCVKLLYSNDFIQIELFLQLLLFGSFIKVGSWAISFVFLAKGDIKVYIRNELIIKFISLVLYLSGYKLGGLMGVGLSFIINYIIYFIIVSITLKHKYNISFKTKSWRLFFLYLFVLGLCIYVSFVENYLIYLILSVTLSVFIISHSLFELNNRIKFIK